MKIFILLAYTILISIFPFRITAMANTEINARIHTRKSTPERVVPGIITIHDRQNFNLEKEEVLKILPSLITELSSPNLPKMRIDLEIQEKTFTRGWKEKYSLFIKLDCINRETGEKVIETFLAEETDKSIESTIVLIRTIKKLLQNISNEIKQKGL